LQAWEADDAVGLALLITGWLVVQAMARRRLPPDAPDRDVLACSACTGPGSCHCGLGGSKAQASNPPEVN
jgi:hypothetical protein